MNTAPRPEQPDFIRRQYEFAAHIRNPAAHPAPPEVEDRRMAIYRELFYNNIEGFLSDYFPVLKSLCAEEDWHGMVRDFMTRHRCRTPYFAQIGREFLDYLQGERLALTDEPAFLLELAHYEWVELALHFSDADEDAPPADPNGDLLACAPVLSPLAWNLSYHYPVHRIGPDFRPQAPGPEPTHLVVYRDRRDEVTFLEINAVTQRLIQLLKETPEYTGQDVLNRIAQELNHPQPEQVMAHGRRLIQDLRNRDIIIGTRR